MAAYVFENMTLGGGNRHSWELTQGDAEGEWAENAGASDRTVQIFGTFGGATVTIEGSNLQPTAATLHSYTGAELVFVSAGIAAIAENPQAIRPVISGATGATNLSVILLSRSTK